MMQDGKCICGWCGSAEHITGARECLALVASKKMQADKQRKSAAAAAASSSLASSSQQQLLQLGARSSPPKTPKRIGQEVISSKAVAVKNTLQFVNQLTATVQASNRKASAIAMGVSFADLNPTPPPTQAISSSPLATQQRWGRRISLKVAATRIISEGVAAAAAPEAPEAPASPSDSSSRATTAETPIPSRPSSTRCLATTPLAPAPEPMSRCPSSQALSRSPSRAGSMSLSSAGLALSVAAAIGRKLSGNSMDAEHGRSLGLGPDDRRGGGNQVDGDGDAAAGSSTLPPPSKAEQELRKASFPEAIQSSYRELLVRKVRRCTTLEQYYETRTSTLEQLKGGEDAVVAATTSSSHQPRTRKPRIPKPQRRLAMCSKTREPRPDRFNRRINRMLKRMWVQDHPLPVVEESLRD
ncbi:hypothetical protein PINS_up009121 [Pythium insidiosum]|nr:hypothetical protein PINS_up009121 [Pythium insidiosum]